MASTRYNKSQSIQNHSSNKADETVQRFASMMIERMEALKNEKWEKGWFNGFAHNGIPQNLTGRTYNGSNSFFLSLLAAEAGHQLPVYLTFDQARKSDVHIKKGEKAYPVIYWNFTIKDQNGHKVSLEDYKNLSKEEQKECDVTPFMKVYPVFNIDQTNFKEAKPEIYTALSEKFKVPEIKDTEGMYKNPAIDRMIETQSWYCPIHADKISDRAFYSETNDEIVLPLKAQFKTHEDERGIYTDGMEFYSTALHEITHSTLHPDRLNREGGKMFGDPQYGREELVAELTAAMIGQSMGFDKRVTDNSAKYVDGWIKIIKEQPKFIISVMSDVNKAFDMILDKVDEQRLALGETPYLSKNMVTVENSTSLEPEFVPVQDLLASEGLERYGLKANVTETPLNFDKARFFNPLDDTTKIIEFLQNKDDDYKLNLLGQMRAECDYYLGNGKGWSGHLMTQDEAKQIEVMKIIHNSLAPEYKPQSLPFDKILDYQDKITNYNNYVGSVKEPSLSYNTSTSDKSEILETFEKYKAKHPDALILIRVGNIYELLGQDAVKASEVLGTELIKGAKENSLELTAFNYKMLSKALPELVRNGHRIAICEDTFSVGKKKDKKEESDLEIKYRPYNEISKAEQQKRERTLIKGWEKDPIVSIINSYQKKYEPKSRIFLEGELPVAHSLLFQGLIDYHQYYAASSPQEYAKFCLSNELEPGYAPAKQLWRNNHESGQPNVYMFPSSGEILHQREQKVDKHNDQELKILAVEEICLNIKNPTPFLNDLEKKGLVTAQERNKIEELLNQNTMAKKKKTEEPVAEKKEEQVKKQEVKTENKTEEKKEEAVKQPREPQMVTVNGDKISHAHIYKTAPDSQENLFIAKMNGNYLRPVAVPQQVAADFIEKKISVEDMMAKYYPTKIAQKVPDVAFKTPNVIAGAENKQLTVEKFNVYKEKDQAREDYGKYKFYAKVDGKNMSTLANQNDLNAYFDKVQTPGQLVEKIFGDRLQLKSHYEQFKLPEGFDSKDVKIVKDKNSNNYVVYLDMGEAGKSDKKELSYHDRDNLFKKIATKDQLGAKYLGAEIETRMGMKQSNKVAETKSLKMS